MSATWIPSMDGDEQYGWHLDLPGDRSAFVAQIENGQTLIAGPAPEGWWEWSVGGCFATYVDAHGVKPSLAAAQRAAENAAQRHYAKRS
jgi:hypothetical protein